MRFVIIILVLLSQLKAWGQTGTEAPACLADLKNKVGYCKGKIDFVMSETQKELNSKRSEKYKLKYEAPVSYPLFLNQIPQIVTLVRQSDGFTFVSYFRPTIKTNLKGQKACSLSVLRGEYIPTELEYRYLSILFGCS